MEAKDEDMIEHILRSKQIVKAQMKYLFFSALLHDFHFTFQYLYAVNGIIKIKIYLFTPSEEKFPPGCIGVAAAET